MFSFFKKKYIHQSQTITGTEPEIGNKIKEWVDQHPCVIPVDISICQSRLSGTVIAVLIYKKEVKSGK